MYCWYSELDALNNGLKPLSATLKLFGTRQKLEHSSDIEIQFHGQNIERVSSFCYLGVTLDEHLSWNEHVEIICHKVSKRPGLLSRIRPYLTQKAAKCVYNCLIQPILNYTDTVWGGLSIGCGKKPTASTEQSSTHSTREVHDR